MHIVLFSPIPFDDLHQRPQKLAGLFRDHGERVLYVGPTGVREALGRGPAFFLRAALDALVLHLRALPQVLTGRPPAPPRISRAAAAEGAGLEVLGGPLGVAVHRTASSWLHALTVAAHRQFLRRSILSRLPAGTPAVALVEDPLWGAVLEPGDFPAVFYDCLDDCASFAGRSPAALWHAWEERLVGLCAGAFATARVLEERLRKVRPALAVERVPNGVDADWFRRQAEHAPAGPNTPRAGRPVAGYVGVIGRWLDFGVIEAALDGCPEMDFVFVGPCSEPAALSRLQRRANFRWVPRRAYDEIPGLVGGFDVCLIPFAPGDIARSTNPVKVFEYFALGKPVVTTPVLELEGYRDAGLLYWAEGAGAFVAALHEAAAERDPARRARRMEVAGANSWEARAGAMLAAMRAAPGVARGTGVAV